MTAPSMPSAPTRSTSSLPPGEPWAFCSPEPPREVGDPRVDLSSPGLGGFALREQGAWKEGRGESRSFVVPPLLHLILPPSACPMARPAHRSAKSCSPAVPCPCAGDALGDPPRRDPSSPGLGILCCSRGALWQQDSDTLFSTMSLFSLPFSLSLSVSAPPHLPSVPQ